MWSEITPADLVLGFNESPKSAEFAFDLSLILEGALGRGAWDKLNDQQRAATLSAAEKTAREISSNETNADPIVARILRSEVRSDHAGMRASVTALMNDNLVRFHLAARRLRGVERVPKPVRVAAGNRPAAQEKVATRLACFIGNLQVAAAEAPRRLVRALK